MYPPTTCQFILQYYRAELTKQLSAIGQTLLQYYRAAYRSPEALGRCGTLCSMLVLYSLL